jgi:polyketide synthase PksN
VKRHKEMVALLNVDEELQEVIGKWLQRGKYEKLLAFWVKGLMVDWKLLYGEHLPRRISLPTYPFARERYWIPIGTSPAATATLGTQPCACPQPTGSLTATGVPLWGERRTVDPLQRIGPASVRSLSYTALHPLVQRNASTLREHRFSSTFHGDEFFLADHMVKGQSVMPGVAYLEMVRTAVAQTNGADASHEPSQLRLSNVVWVCPLICDRVHPVTVHTVLEAQESGRISFLVRRDVACAPDVTEIGQAQVLVPTALCQGTAELHALSSPPPNVDLAAVQARCQRQFSATECYQRYRELGISYGPAHQGIEYLSVGEDEVLARLRLPSVVTQTHTDFVLHPSMLDSALQASIGLLVEPEEHQESQAPTSQTQVPFALDELEVASEVPAQGWAWVRRRSHSMTESVFDIEMCEDAGCVVLRLRGLRTRRLLSEEQEATQQETEMGDWAADNAEEVFREKIIAYLKELAGKVLNLPSTKIDTAETLFNYGLDSILQLQLMTTLRRNMGLADGTLFIECTTIDALVEYLLHTHKEALEHLLGITCHPTVSSCSILDRSKE